MRRVVSGLGHAHGALLALGLVLTGCGVVQPEPEATASKGSGESPRIAAGDARASDGERARVLFVGTSLTAGLGLAEEEAYPARVAERLSERGTKIEALNAGVSGDTSAGGLERMDWLLRRAPDVVLIELGANDGLRGLEPEMTEANLLQAIEKSRAVGARVIVAGMMMPPNYGEDYTKRFAAVFPRVAELTGSALIPFLLDGVAADPDLNQADGIHPNAAGHERIAETVLPYVLEAVTDRLGSVEEL